MSGVSWAAQELAQADFGDARLNQRLFTLVDALAAQPEASVPQACGTWAATKAAYRFMAHEQVTPEAVRAAQQSAVVARAKQETCVLVIQDTTELDLSAHASTRGLGPLGAASQQGVKVHSALLASTQGVPLGVLWQQVWARDPDTRGQSKDWRKREADDKESRKWGDGLAATQNALPATVPTITVADREADMYPLFAAPRQAHTDYVIRAAYNRRVSSEARRLHTALANAPLLGSVCVTVGRRAGHATRQATLEVRVATVTLVPPAYYKDAYPPVTVQALVAHESAPPEGCEAVCWRLLTTLPLDTFAQACECLHIYACRWLIERYHFTLKSGCRLERLQLQSAARLEVALALYNVVAWRLLWLTYAARHEADVSCGAYLHTHEWQALYATIHRTPEPPDAPPSLRQAVRWIAQLGGFLARNGDGEPGVQTLWRGMRRLQDIAETWRLLHPQTYG